MREDGDASDKPLDVAVLTRMKQFRAMNKLKKVALKVRLFNFYYLWHIVCSYWEAKKKIVHHTRKMLVV